MSDSKRSRQLNLFPADRERLRARSPDQFPLQPPSMTAHGTADSALAAKRKSELVFRLSQLQESKFLQLFRYLVDSRGSRGKAAVPLDFPDVELHFKFDESLVSLSTYTSAWLFQIAYAPSCLWSSERFEVFLRERLEKAFFNLKTMPPTFQTRPAYSGPLDGALTVFESASDGCADYYVFTNVCIELEEGALSAGRKISPHVIQPSARHTRRATSQIRVWDS